MANVEVLRSADIAPLFTCLHGEVPHTGARLFANQRYRSMLLETAPKTKDRRFTNIIQLANPKFQRELALKYPDEICNPAQSFIERVFAVHKGQMAFGLGDLHRDAPMLFFTDKDGKEITAMLKWMRENLSDPALAIRLQYSVRVSFTDENDYVLARLKFV